MESLVSEQLVPIERPDGFATMILNRPRFTDR